MKSWMISYDFLVSYSFLLPAARIQRCFFLNSKKLHRLAQDHHRWFGVQSPTAPVVQPNEEIYSTPRAKSGRNWSIQNGYQFSGWKSSSQNDFGKEAPPEDVRKSFRILIDTLRVVTRSKIVCHYITTTSSAGKYKEYNKIRCEAHKYRFSASLLLQ